MGDILEAAGSGGSGSAGGGAGIGSQPWPLTAV